MNNDSDKKKRSQNPEGGSKAQHSEKRPKNEHPLDSEDTIEIASPGGALSASYAPDDIASPSSPKSSQADTSPANLHESKRERQTTATPPTDSGVKRLSSEQVENIASRFSVEHEVISESDREQYLKSLGSVEKKARAAQSKPTSEGPRRKPEKKSTASVVPVASGGTTSTMRSPEKTVSSSAAKGPARGVAYFSGQRITLGAAERMKSGDEITVNGNRYQLKPGGSHSHVFGYVIAGALIVAAAFGGKYFLAEGDVKGGSISGVALSEDNAPYQEGAVVRLPELGKSTVTNSEGLFQFSDVPNGTYKIEYNLAGSLGGSQTISVTDNATALVTLDGATKRLAQAVKETRKRETQTQNRPTKRAKTKSVTKSKVTASKGALAVTSDVSGATVFIDNQKLGKVNHTFRRMNTGKRSLRIEKDGYETFIGNVTINPDKIAKVNVTLVPLAVQEEQTAPDELSAGELFEQGRESFKAGDNQDAILIFNEALKKNPGLADAYFFRAEALTKAGKPQDAYLDYIRAGEIWSQQKRNQDALSAFDNAIEVSNGAALAYKVRGDFYVNSKRRSKGIADYQKALKVDKKYYEAHLALGIAYFETGSYRKADKELRRAQDYNDKDAVLYHYLMFNSLAKNDLGDVQSYYKQFKKKASPAELSRFDTDKKLAAVRRVVKD